mgnify:CR=1 FL=1
MRNPTLEIKSNKGSYIHVNKISPKDTFRHAIFTQGYRYEIASNKFGTSHYKTLKEATRYAGKLMRTIRK